MPGAYAHITLVNHAQKRLDEAGLSNETAYALEAYLKFLELGSVSPDYPYLALGEGKWADKMHYTNTSSLLKAGVRQVQNLAGGARAKATSWLLGFAAHMTTDMTIHPIVEGIVGPYKGNESAHRKCEMHQDAFIFQKLDLGDVGLTQHLESGIAACHDPRDKEKLEGAVTSAWRAMLEASYPEDARQSPPDPNKWHNGFTSVFHAMGKTNRLFPFARHVAVNLNLAYPERAGVLNEYIVKLKTPEGHLDYENIFERACQNVLDVWKGLDMALIGGRTTFLDTLDDWNLDTGKSIQTNTYVFWKGAV